VAERGQMEAKQKGELRSFRWARLVKIRIKSLSLDIATRKSLEPVRKKPDGPFPSQTGLITSILLRNQEIL
jgi:hypothetical protein